MPVLVSVDPNKRLIVVKGQGIVTDDDLLGFVREYLHDRDLAQYDELVDLSDADLFDLTYAGLASVADAAAASDRKNESTRIAILISESQGAGLSRIYQTLREDRGGLRETRVFWSRKECLEWLEPDPDPSPRGPSGA
jgi:hypothetical protein